MSGFRLALMSALLAGSSLAAGCGGYASYGYRVPPPPAAVEVGPVGYAPVPATCGSTGFTISAATVGSGAAAIGTGRPTRTPSGRGPTGNGTATDTAFTAATGGRRRRPGNHRAGRVVLPVRRMCFLNSERAQFSFHAHKCRARLFLAAPQRHCGFPYALRANLLYSSSDFAGSSTHSV